MDTAHRRPVIVGYDGSASSSAALEAGAAQALALGAPLRLVHAYVWPILYSSLANVPYHAGEWAPAPSTVAMLQQVADRLTAEHPGLVVTTEVVPGGGGQVLVESSAQAALLVVGASGIGGVAGLLAGSVAPHVAARAQCPVLVVRPGPAPNAASTRVVVGIDGTPSSINALRFACEWALRSRSPQARVVAMYAVLGADFDEPAPESGARPPAQANLDGWIDEVRGDYPSVVIEGRVVRGDAGAALLDASRSARLVVVGSRNLGELKSLALGSVGMSLIRHASTQVAVVHGEPNLATPTQTPASHSSAL